MCGGVSAWVVKCSSRPPSSSAPLLTGDVHAVLHRLVLEEPAGRKNRARREIRIEGPPAQMRRSPAAAHSPTAAHHISSRPCVQRCCCTTGLYRRYTASSGSGAESRKSETQWEEEARAWAARRAVGSLARRDHFVCAPPALRHRPHPCASAASAPAAPRSHPSAYTSCRSKRGPHTPQLPPWRAAGSGPVRRRRRAAAMQGRRAAGGGGGDATLFRWPRPRRCVLRGLYQKRMAGTERPAAAEGTRASFGRLCATPVLAVLLHRGCGTAARCVSGAASAANGSGRRHSCTLYLHAAGGVDSCSWRAPPRLLAQLRRHPVPVRDGCAYRKHIRLNLIHASCRREHAGVKKVWKRINEQLETAVLERQRDGGGMEGRTTAAWGESVRGRPPGPKTGCCRARSKGALKASRPKELRKAKGGARLRAHGERGERLRQGCRSTKRSAEGGVR